MYNLWLQGKNAGTRESQISAKFKKHLYWEISSIATTSFSQGNPCHSFTVFQF